MIRTVAYFVAFAALVAFADEPTQFVPGLLHDPPGKGIRVRSLWANWILGLDPANADVRDITLSIDISSGVPRVFWDPVLSGRTYTLYGCDCLSPAATWYAVPTNELDTTSARFFRLSIGLQQ